MKILMITLILSSCAACSTVSKSSYQEALTDVERLEKELRVAKKERDQAREDYEADILRAFRRDELDRKYPYSGMPRVPDWVEPLPEESTLAEDAAAFCAAQPGGSCLSQQEGEE